MQKEPGLRASQLLLEPFVAPTGKPHLKNDITFVSRPPVDLGSSASGWG